MKPEQAKRLKAVRALIDSDWGADHFDLGIEVKGDLEGAFKRKETGCGAAGCVAGFIPLVNEHVECDEYGTFYVETDTRELHYIDIATHEQGFGLSEPIAKDLCDPREYPGGWTRSGVLRRIDKILAGES